MDVVNTAQVPGRHYYPSDTRLGSDDTIGRRDGVAAHRQASSRHAPAGKQQTEIHPADTPARAAGKK